MKDLNKLLFSDNKEKVTKTLDYQMLDANEILDRKIVDVFIHIDNDTEELQLILDNGKQIQISLINGKVDIQSD